jgi:CRISPR type III-B/RAMP module RAMP protein Cmr6
MRQFILDLAGPLDRQTKKRPQDRRGQHHGEGQHAGLLLQRYLCENAAGDAGNPEEKRAILRAAINAAASGEVRALYQIAFDRWSASLPADPPPVDLVTDGRLIVGLGSESVLETGIRLHHTYGMPVIPGSALKGLAAHYCDQAWGAEDSRFKKPTAAEDQAYRAYLQAKGPKPEDNFHRLLFGTTDDSGCIVFHDSRLKPDSPDSPNPLVLDVMTPHHPKWNDVGDPVAPTDFDSPTPVPFLSVAGAFRVAVSWRGPASDQAKNWTELALSLLREALKNWGIGGKTSSGYGRLLDVEDRGGAQTSPGGVARSASRRSGRIGSVKVRFLGPHNKLKNAFWVQEAGKKRGLLKYGTAPPQLPALDSEIDVYSTNDNPNSPEYRWDPPAPPNPSRSGSGDQRSRGRR